MRLLKLAFVLPLLAACSQDDSGTAPGAGGQQQALCTEYVEQSACEAHGCAWDQCPPNADCAYLCSDGPDGQAGPDGEQTPDDEQPSDDGQPSDDEQPSDDVQPSDDGEGQGCDTEDRAPGQTICIPPDVLEEAEAERACQTQGGTWELCPPNADCVHWCREGEQPADPDAGTPQPSEPDSGVAQPSDGCEQHATQSACEATLCDWRACPPGDSAAYHCVDLHCLEAGQSEESCQAAGCEWQACPSNADCAFQCRDAAWDTCAAQGG